jgi:serine/threonine protein kinase
LLFFINSIIFLSIQYNIILSTISYINIKANEKKILTKLRNNNIPVPIIYDFFYVKNNIYLVIKEIEGQNIYSLIKEKKINLEDFLIYANQITNIVSSIHQSGLIWRDCKPSNLIVDNTKKVTAIDFEGACDINKICKEIWGTEGYIAPESFNEQEKKYTKTYIR